MERLTFDGNFCDIAQCRELPCQYNGACSQRKVWERLKAYEDTGLTPGEVHSMHGEWSTMMAALNSIGGGYTRLRELAEADKDGRLVVRPCKIGDVLYRASPSGVVVHRVANMVYRELTSRWYIDTIPNLPYASEELGKTTFLTREEAEKNTGGDEGWLN